MYNTISEKYKYVAGVDTHAKKHVLVVVDNLGKQVGKPREIRVTEQQMRNTVLWAKKKYGADILFALEGTSSYGQTFCQILFEEGMTVIEVKPPKTTTRGLAGKTDEIDAREAALTALSTPSDRTINPRIGKQTSGLRVLVSARRLMSIQHNQDKNALNALLRCNDLGVDARKPVTDHQIQTISHWRNRSNTVNLARLEAIRLAEAIIEREILLEKNKQQLAELVNEICPVLLSAVGCGPVTAAVLLCAYSYTGRVHSAAAFACLAGTTPIPASSGNTTRHRLSRRGDRQLNHALTTIVMTRMRCDPETKLYVEKQTKKGKNPREIRRLLKRYIARSMFKAMEKYNISVVI